MACCSTPSHVMPCRMSSGLLASRGNVHRPKGPGTLPRRLPCMRRPRPCVWSGPLAVLHRARSCRPSRQQFSRSFLLRDQIAPCTRGHAKAAFRREPERGAASRWKLLPRLDRARAVFRAPARAVPHPVLAPRAAGSDEPDSPRPRIGRRADRAPILARSRWHTGCAAGIHRQASG